MAGDTKETSATETPPPIVDDPFPGIQATLDRIADVLDLAGEGQLDFSATGTLIGGPSHARMRCRYLVFSTTAAATVTLTIGTMTRTYSVPAADTRVIPLPLVIERGLDITLSASAGAVTGALIVRPE